MEYLHNSLESFEIPFRSSHGGYSQEWREEAMIRFKKGTVPILVSHTYGSESRRWHHEHLPECKPCLPRSLVPREPTASSTRPLQERALASRRDSLTIAVRAFVKSSVSTRISTTRTGSTLSGISAGIITTKAGLISILALSTSVR